MKALQKKDRDVLSLLSEGMPDTQVRRRLSLRVDQLADSLERIRASAEAHPGGNASLRYERALRRQLQNHVVSLKARFDALLDASQEAILIVNGLTGVIQQANVRAAEMFSYPLDQLVGMTVEELMPYEHRPIHPAYRIGFLVSVKKREVGYHPPVFGLRSDGSKLEMAINLTSSGADDEVMVVCSERVKLGRNRKLHERGSSGSEGHCSLADSRCLVVVSKDSKSHSGLSSEEVPAARR